MYRGVIHAGSAHTVTCVEPSLAGTSQLSLPLSTAPSGTLSCHSESRSSNATPIPLPLQFLKCPVCAFLNPTFDPLSLQTQYSFIQLPMSHPPFFSSFPITFKNVSEPGPQGEKEGELGVPAKHPLDKEPACMPLCRKSLCLQAPFEVSQLSTSPIKKVCTMRQPEGKRRAKRTNQPTPCTCGKTRAAFSLLHQGDEITELLF